MYINIKSKYKKIFWLLLGFAIACILCDRVCALTMPNGYEVTDQLIIDIFNNVYSEITPNDLFGTTSSDPRYTKKYKDAIDPFNNILIRVIDNNCFWGFYFQDNAYIGVNDVNQYLYSFNVWPSQSEYITSPMITYCTDTHTFYRGNFNQGSLTENYFRKDDTEYKYVVDITNNNPAGDISYPFAMNFDIIYNDQVIKNRNLYYPDIIPTYLHGYKKITIPAGTQYTMISSSQISSGYVYIPIEDFNYYGGRLSYFDKDLSSQPYTSYIQDYTITPDGLFARQYFDLSSYNGADWVMFSKYIYLEGEDNFSYDIWVPIDSYSSLVTVTPNSSGGNDFDFSYIDQSGDLQADIISSVDLTPPQPLLGDIFQNFTTNDFGLSSIITAPLPLIQSLNSATCTDLSLPLGIFGGAHDNRLVLPCMTPHYQTWFGELFTLYQTITTGFIAYYVGLAFFNKIKQLKDPENDIIEVVDL